jgi:hypothetical protein
MSNSGVSVAGSFSEGSSKAVADPLEAGLLAVDCGEDVSPPAADEDDDEGSGGEVGCADELPHASGTSAATRTAGVMSERTVDGERS